MSDEPQTQGKISAILQTLSQVPAWVILLPVFLYLSCLWHIRPDADTQTMMKEILAALLLSLRIGNNQTPTK